MSVSIFYVSISFVSDQYFEYINWSEVSPFLNCTLLCVCPLCDINFPFKKPYNESSKQVDNSIRRRVRYKRECFEFHDFYEFYGSQNLFSAVTSLSRLIFMFLLVILLESANLYKNPFFRRDQRSFSQVIRAKSA